jgi:hypothetical protein
LHADRLPELACAPIPAPDLRCCRAGLCLAGLDRGLNRYCFWSGCKMQHPLNSRRMPLRHLYC